PALGVVDERLQCDVVGRDGAFGEGPVEAEFVDQLLRGHRQRWARRGRRLRRTDRLVLGSGSVRGLLLGDPFGLHLGGERRRPGADLLLAVPGAGLHRVLVGADLRGAGDGVHTQVERARLAVGLVVVVDALDQPDVLPGGVQAEHQHPVLAVHAHGPDPVVLRVVDRFDVQARGLRSGAQGVEGGGDLPGHLARHLLQGGQEGVRDGDDAVAHESPPDVSCSAARTVSGLGPTIDQPSCSREARSRSSSSPVVTPIFLSGQAISSGTPVPCSSPTTGGSTSYWETRPMIFRSVSSNASSHASCHAGESGASAALAGAGTGAWSAGSGAGWWADGTRGARRSSEPTSRPASTGRRVVIRSGSPVGSPWAGFARCSQARHDSAELSRRSASSRSSRTRVRLRGFGLTFPTTASASRARATFRRVGSVNPAGLVPSRRSTATRSRGVVPGV